MLITHGLVATCDERNTLLVDGAIKTTGDRIVEVGPSAELLARYAGEERVDARGRLVLPGMICAHTHFYSAFARGIPPRGEPATDLGEILERLWWRLDCALRPEDIQASAAISLVDAVRHGVTTLIDHHASPHFVDGSLDLIADEVRRAGVRACLCYEVSDRQGLDNALAGIQENARFIRLCQKQGDSTLAGLMGLHASFTLSDETLRTAVGAANDQAVGCHIHVAEGKLDQADSLKRSGLRVVERLHKAGLVNDRLLAAHCVNVDAYEIDLLRQAGAGIVHNPRSNMNNAVGTAPIPRLMHDRMIVGLGTDGFPCNMFAEMQAAYLIHKAATGDPRTLPADQIMRMAFTNNRRIAARCFQADVGALVAGAQADIIVVDYLPATPIQPDNLPAHLIFGIDSASVRTTICAGRMLMQDGNLLTLDEAATTARARELARKLWARY